jgi:hypothetical protein
MEHDSMRKGFLSLVLLALLAPLARTQTPYAPPGYGYPADAWRYGYANYPGYNNTSIYYGYPATQANLARYAPQPSDAGKVPSQPAGIEAPSSNVSTPPEPQLVAAPPAHTKCSERLFKSELSPFWGGTRGTRGLVFWGDAEYLYWWVKNGPASPLVTTGSTADVHQGALGQPHTKVLFGDTSMNFGALSGGRFTLGVWLDPCRVWGFEASGFFLSQGAVHFSASSNSAGLPTLYIPFTDPVGTPRGFIISTPANSSDQLQPNGTVNVLATSQLWGTEGNVYLNVVRSRCLDVSLLGGFRYLNLQESLTDSGSFNVVMPGTGTASDAFTEGFATRSQFFGPQLGVSVGSTWGVLSATLIGKVACGVNYNSVNINGAITQAGVAPIGTFPGAVLTQPTNIGDQTHNQFSIVPQLSLKLAWQITHHIRLIGGYDFLFWTNVVRPGDQIDHNINFSQSPVAQLGGTSLVGPALPTPLFNNTSFFAQGASLGVEIRY